MSDVRYDATEAARIVVETPLSLALIGVPSGTAILTEPFRPQRLMINPMQRTRKQRMPPEIC